MIANSLTTRSVQFAFLFGRPRFVTREEASKVYGRICDAASIDDFTYQYSTSAGSRPSSQGFEIKLARKEGRGQFGIVINNPDVTQKPMRLLLAYDWPPILSGAQEHFDMVSKAVFEALEGPWQKVHAEVRLRAQCSVSGKDAVDFIKTHILRLEEDWLNSLGNPVIMASVKFEVPAGRPIVNSLDNPGRELIIEVLREDRKCAYLELVTKWPQIPTMFEPSKQIDLSSARTIDQNPSKYIEEAYDYLSERLKGLF